MTKCDEMKSDMLFTEIILTMSRSSKNKIGKGKSNLVVSERSFVFFMMS